MVGRGSEPPDSSVRSTRCIQFRPRPAAARDFGKVQIRKASERFLLLAVLRVNGAFSKFTSPADKSKRVDNSKNTVI